MKIKNFKDSHIKQCLDIKSGDIDVLSSSVLPNVPNVGKLICHIAAMLQQR